MFDYRHSILFKNSEAIYLYGEDYFGDKSTFWKSHQSTLKSLCEKVCLVGFPITITDLKTESVSEIQTKQEFDNWISTNQPFTCNCGSTTS